MQNVLNCIIGNSANCIDIDPVKQNIILKEVLS
jgi:hypothetical protein